MMELIRVQQPEAWEPFITSTHWNSFLQSWEWGTFQQSQGHQVERFQLIEGKNILAAAQLIHYRKPFSGYWFAPRGPVLALNTEARSAEILTFLVKELNHHLPVSRRLFTRYEPMLEHGTERVMPDSCLRSHAMNPTATRLIDLTKSEDILLAEMHQKTRYNIRLAEKHGVTVREGSMDDLDIFFALTNETASRDQFVPMNESYLRNLFESLSTSGMARLRLAEYEGQTLAANMEIAYGDTVTYLHGASSNKNRQVMAPFALQWDAIKAAKASKHALYDLWGCNPASKDAPGYKSSWEGISRFKSGLGGRLIELEGTWDQTNWPLLYRLTVGK